MMARRRGAGGPIPSMELLYRRRRAHTAPDDIRAWVEDNREMLTAHAEGAPCRDGRDGRDDARRLLALVSS